MFFNAQMIIDTEKKLEAKKNNFSNLIAANFLRTKTNNIKTTAKSLE